MMNKKEQVKIHVIITAHFQYTTELLVSSVQINLIT